MSRRIPYIRIAPKIKNRKVRKDKEAEDQT